MASIARIVEEARDFNGKGTYDPYEGLNLIYVGVNAKENEKWTQEEDAFLLCEIVKQCQFGLFGQIRRGCSGGAIEICISAQSFLDMSGKCWGILWLSVLV